jgi:hypothetical protein
VSGYTVVKKFFSGDLMTTSNFVHALMVLLIILGVELLAMFIAARVIGWFVRRAAAQDLLRALLDNSVMAFPDERKAVSVAREAISAIADLRSVVQARDVSRRPE